MRVVSKILYWFFLSAVVALGALLILSLVPLFGIKVKIVKSGSMEPAIQTGGIIAIMPANSYNVGDVITFGADTKTQIPTTHRIVAIEGSGASQVFTTKGDANDANDPATTPVSQVKGKVLFTVPYLGFVLDFARQPLGFALLVGVPAVWIIFEEILKIVRELGAMRRRTLQPHAQTTTPVRKRIVD